MPHSPLETLSLDSAKGILSLWKPSLFLLQTAKRGGYWSSQIENDIKLYNTDSFTLSVFFATWHFAYMSKVNVDILNFLACGFVLDLFMDFDFGNKGVQDFGSKLLNISELSGKFDEAFGAY